MLTLTSDRDLRITARLVIGWSQPWSGRHADALGTLIAVAAEASRGRRPSRGTPPAWPPRVACQTRLPEACTNARTALDARDALGEPVPSAKDRPAGWADERRIWITDQLTLQQRYSCDQARRS